VLVLELPDGPSCSKEGISMWVRLVASLVVVTLTGCPAVRRAHKAEESGFLSDYSQLTPGGSDEALLRYRNPNADLSKYDKVILDPVQIWAKPGSPLAKLPKEDADSLTSYLYHAVQARLVQRFEIVGRPGPRTLRLRLALTEAEGSTVALDVATTVIPQAALVSEGVQLATGARGFAGAATIEGEVLDASTGERLGAFVDREVGAKRLGERMFEKWGDVKSACDFWAERIGQRLREG
jgi:hypothetical protein